VGEEGSKKMNQFGMQLPGGQMQRGPMMNVYTGLLLLAVIALAAASVMVFLNAGKVGKDGKPFELQEAGRIVVK
jgi:hypothetical protein